MAVCCQKLSYYPFFENYQQIHRRKRERVVAVVQPTVYYFVQNHFILLNVPSKGYRSHNYQLFVLDLLDHPHRPIFHFIFSREDWITGGFMCKISYHVMLNFFRFSLIYHRRQAH
ncbi:hypothetical protein DAPPUDRAFT_313554 [Daphnia pulex]|uniref:Uncharacterized protein n=1 Tax=Daphnia pulex TaxID=6669 RepID=E9G3G5_DAPPU|nr:hypothetical protein DAPPUDRAFT_313554 [Daphnia pulex]|eukprot:EFX85994.1 hypothetical protein DAPPUDRAFT_313554 [Daphnia pulex]